MLQAINPGTAADTHGVHQINAGFISSWAARRGGSASACLFFAGREQIGVNFVLGFVAFIKRGFWGAASLIFWGFTKPQLRACLEN
ncbi:MAG: hypothetical protein CVT49_07590 [candidate division Zixibacteria bacterium HGW-Zixibacteria-1]|nr:MAG: hypothetical protein CVT49_07590 [candidate division Zixibacteria bacterium HGW-Zixibacteria-1]